MCRDPGPVCFHIGLIDTRELGILTSDCRYYVKKYRAMNRAYGAATI